MNVIALDSNGDWDITSLKTETEAVFQTIRTRLREWYNDAWFNLNAGIDWRLLPDLSTAQAQLYLDAKCKEIILNTNDVQDIISFNSSIKEQSSKYFLFTVFTVKQKILPFEDALILL